MIRAILGNLLQRICLPRIAQSTKWRVRHPSICKGCGEHRDARVCDDHDKAAALRLADSVCEAHRQWIQAASRCGGRS